MKITVVGAVIIAIGLVLLVAILDAASNGKNTKPNEKRMKSDEPRNDPQS